VLLKTGLSLDERIEVLAHELQHVREVIQAGIPNGRAAMYETEAARQIAATVARELARS
jgi:predicted metallopeptidase